MKFLRDLFWPTYYSWRMQGLGFVVYFVVFLLLGAYPALNVLVIGYLGEQISSNGAIQQALLYLVLLFGLYNAFFMIVVSFGRCVMVSIAFKTTSKLADHVAASPARLYNDQAYTQQMMQAFGAVSYNHLANHNQAIFALANGVFTAGMLCWSLWLYNPWVAIIAMLLPIPVTITNLVYGQQQTKAFPERNGLARRREYLHDQLANDRTGFDLSSMRASSALALIAQGVTQQWRRVTMRMHHLSFVFSSITGMITIAMYAVCLYILISQGDLVSLLTGIFGMTAILTSLTGIGYNIGALMQAIPSNSTFRNFLAHQEAPVHRLSVAQDDQLQFANVHVSYGEKEVVKGVTLELQRNRLTALVGANGSGKTTLVKALMGAQMQATGTAKSASLELDLSSTTQALNFATVNQEFQRFDLSIREFLTLGLTRDVSDAELWQVLEKVEFADYVRQLPQALDTETGIQWGGIDLSGGQWQRLCVARGMLSDAGLLFLDEPTSAIDAPTEERIFGHLAQLSADRLILLTTHRVSTLKDAQMIYVIEQGKIVEAGSFTQLNRPGTAFRKLFESQFIAEQEAQTATTAAQKT